MSKKKSITKQQRATARKTNNTSEHEKTIQELNSLIQRGLIQEAKNILQKIPDETNDHRIISARAHILYLENRTYEAIELSKKALEKGGKQNSSILANHGALLNNAGYFEETIALLKPYVQAYPGIEKMENALTHALIRGGYREEALQLLSDKLERNNVNTQTLNDLGKVLFDIGERELGFNQYKMATKLAPGNNPIFSNLLLVAHYLPHLKQKELKNYYEQWYTNIISHLPVTTEFERSRNPDRPLRIGFISNGFRAHPAGWLSIGGIRVLSSYFSHEIVIYNKTAFSEKDPLGPAFPKFATLYRNVVGWSEDELYQQMIADQLDIIIEMTGHSGDSALPVIARRVAPIQVKWVGGLFDTSATPTMDYLLSDWRQTPKGTEKDFVERLIRLPNGYVTYTEPPHLPEVGPLPSQDGKPFTFISTNNLLKINEVIAGVWSRILNKVPNSYLLIKDHRLNDPKVRNWLNGLFSSNNVDTERLLLEEASPHDELLQTYNRADLALDSWPYTGGLTTIEAIYMGVPVVTTPGETFAGKHASSHLANVGLNNFIAQDFEDYVDIAVSWANNPDELERLREGLRKQCQDSPLGNHVQFATDLDHALRLIWKNWCEEKEPLNLNFQSSVPIPEHAYNKMQESIENTKNINEKIDPRSPPLTFPKEVGEFLVKKYREAKSILEYGSGGSTVFASSQPNKLIYTVESDSAWLCQIALGIRERQYPSQPFIYHVDIGETTDWGYPVDDSAKQKWPNYSSRIWSENFLENPDIVLIDGRFRVACFLATAFHCRKNTTILFDDYLDREYYDVVEKIAIPTHFVGRMAIFEIVPDMISHEQIKRLEHVFYDPR